MDVLFSFFEKNNNCTGISFVCKFSQYTTNIDLPPFRRTLRRIFRSCIGNLTLLKVILEFIFYWIQGFVIYCFISLNQEKLTKAIQLKTCKKLANLTRYRVSWWLIVHQWRYYLKSCMFKDIRFSLSWQMLWVTI